MGETHWPETGSAAHEVAGDNRSAPGLAADAELLAPPAEVAKITASKCKQRSHACPLRRRWWQLTAAPWKVVQS